MNDRIRELIEQATTKEEFYPAGCNGYPDYRYEFDKEKFAELIVEECRTVINDLYHKMPLELAVVLIDADNEIMKHFYGVEE